MEREYYLEVEDAYGYSRRFPLSDTQVIGRGDGVDVFIPDMSTSRTHARLLLKDDKWILEDLGSSLGTFINGVKVKKAQVDLNTELRFGEDASYTARIVCIDEKEKARLAMLSNIFIRLTTDFNIREVLDCIIQNAISLIQAERGLILFLQENTSQPRIYIAKDTHGNPIEIDVLKLSEGTISRVLKEGKPLFSTNLEDDDDIVSKDSIIRLSLKSIFVIPLEVNNEIFGLIYLDNSITKNTFNSEDVEYMLMFAKQAALAINTYDLIQEKVGKERLAAVGQVAAKVIHDLRNHLSSIRGYTEILDTGSFNPAKRKAFTSKMQVEIDSMVSYIQEILDYSKGTQELNMESIDLILLIEESLMQFSHKCEAKSIKIKRNFRYKGRLIGDSNKLERVVINLFDNAFYAVPEGEEVWVETGSNETEVYFLIKNPGEPIHEQHLLQIFEPFKTFGKPSGTGLGLSIVSQIVKNHNGRITVTSNHKEGTIFTVYLPVQSASKA